MSDDYTPSDIEIRNAFEARDAYARDLYGELTPRWVILFDRWLAEHDRQVAAEERERIAVEMKECIASGDIAEVAAYVPGEVGRGEAIARRDSLYEEPESFVRDLPPTSEQASPGPVAGGLPGLTDVEAEAFMAAIDKSEPTEEAKPQAMSDDYTRVETWEQLNALPVGSIIIDPFDAKENAPVIACKTARGDWQIMGDHPERRWSPQSIVECARQPLRVIHQPTAEEARP